MCDGFEPSKTPPMDFDEIDKIIWRGIILGPSDDELGQTDDWYSFLGGMCLIFASLGAIGMVIGLLISACRQTWNGDGIFLVGTIIGAFSLLGVTLMGRAIAKR